MDKLLKIELSIFKGTPSARQDT